MVNMKPFRLHLILAALIWVLLTTTTPARLHERQTRPPAPATNLVSLFNVAGNLGFATIRLSYSNPAEPLPQPVVDWLIRDFPNARQWAAPLTSCIPFDLARFDQATAVSRSGALSRDIWPTVDRLHRDYATAVGQASCTLGLPDAQQLHAFFMGGLFTGFSVARASYFAGAPPLHAGVITQIRGDVPAIKGGYAAAAGCGAGIAALSNRLDSVIARLGAVSGSESWQDLVGVYQATEAALQAGTCVGRPPSPPAGDQSCREKNCAAACKGAVMLLGVLSGSPECMACMEKFCKRPISTTVAAASTSPRHQSARWPEPRRHPSP
jgi:hypothetical protein